MSRKWIIVLLFVIGFLIYSNSLFNPFVYDDEFWVISPHTSPVLQALKDWSSNRFIPLLSFALNNFLFGTSSLSYHITNILIHIANAILVFLFWTFTFRTPKMTELEETDDPSIAKKIAIFSSILFLVHPIQTSG